MGNSHVHPIYEENSREITNQILLPFVGKFARIKCRDFSSSRTSSGLEETWYGSITVIIYDTSEEINPLYSINTYITGEVRLQNNLENKLHRINSISFVDQTTVVPGYIWGQTTYPKYILNIKFDGYTNEPFTSNRPFRIFDNYPIQLFEQARPGDLIDYDHNY